MTKEEVKQYELQIHDHLIKVEEKLCVEFDRFDNLTKEYLFIFDKTQPFERLRFTRKGLEYVSQVNGL
jgi:hypothetical protein